MLTCVVTKKKKKKKKKLKQFGKKCKTNLFITFEQRSKTKFITNAMDTKQANFADKKTGSYTKGHAARGLNNNNNNKT